MASKCSCGCGSDGPKPSALAQITKDLDQSERTLRRWVDAGCPHHKGPGRTGRLTFDQAEVVAWMRELGRTGEVGAPTAEITLLAGGSRKSAAPAQAAPDASPPSPPKSDGKKPSRDELYHLTAVANLRIKELEAQKRARMEREADGDVHEVGPCRAASVSKIHAVKATFQILPGKLAQRLTMKPYDEVYAVLAQELDDVLQGFAR